MDMQRSSRLRLLLTPYLLDMKIYLHSCMVRSSTFEDWSMYSIYNLYLWMLNYSIGHCMLHWYSKTLGRFCYSFSTCVPWFFSTSHLCFICCTDVCCLFLYDSSPTYASIRSVYIMHMWLNSTSNPSNLTTSVSHSTTPMCKHVFFISFQNLTAMTSCWCTISRLQLLRHEICFAYTCVEFKLD